MELKVQIVRWVDDGFPGWVECEFVDAENSRHTFIEKVPVVGEELFGRDTSYPRTGGVRCEILAAWRDALGRDLVRITTDRPDCVESTKGVSEFVVLAAQTLSAEATIADLERKAGECEERAKVEPDRIATALRHNARQCREWIAALKNGHWR